MPEFRNVKDYWETRYREGMTSGSGSYGKLAKYKASVLNDFVEKNKIQSVIEWGCGDGAQLKLAKYPKTLGLDISETSIQNCINLFSKDKTKSFLAYDQNNFANPGVLIRADLCLSLDVVYHLVEEEVFVKYMNDLFDTADKFVIIYSSNSSDKSNAPHVKHRKIVDWTRKKRKDFKFVEKLNNPHFPFNPDKPTETTFAEFYIFKKV